MQEQNNPVYKKVVSFQDLDVYQNAYQAMIAVFKDVLPSMPAVERFDLKDQLRRSTKAIPRLIAEGYSKRHQARGFQKYLDDAIAESNETVVSLMQLRDLYPACDCVTKLNALIDSYDKIGRQCYKLALSWDGFNKQVRKTFP